MKRVNAIAAVGAAILAIGTYLAWSGLLAPASSEVAAVAGASPTASPSPRAAALETALAEFGVFAPTSSEIDAATGAPSSRAMSSAAGATLASRDATLETVALKVDGMWCPSCAYFVHQALTRTAGVLDAKVSASGGGKAVVTYDPSKTTVAALIAATTNYGYPSRVIR